MKKIIAFLCCFIFSQANAYYSLCDFCFEEISFDITAGYRCDHLKWSIQGANGVPNVLSELDYHNIKSAQIGAEGRVITCENFYGRLNLDYAWIQDGNFQDSDFLGNNRTLEFSHSVGDIKGDDFFDATIGFGYYTDICCSGFWFAPVAGYTYNRQNFRMTNGVTIIGVPPGPFDGLNSTYQAWWNTGWLGFDFGYDSCDGIILFVTYERHWGRFDALGNWNLRDDIIGSFKHEACSIHGNFVRGGGKFLFCDCWMIGVTGQWLCYESRPGEDRTTGVFQAGIFPSSTGLNPVTWSSYSVLFDIGYKF